MSIVDHIEKKFPFEYFKFQEHKNLEEAKNIYENSKHDSIYCYNLINQYLGKNKKILEVGGGLHLLTSYLNEKYDVTSIEPGNFTGVIENLRKALLHNTKINVHSIKLEDFNKYSQCYF